jgi:hypothetical protein
MHPTWLVFPLIFIRSKETYERRYERWRMMPLYTVHVVEHRRYYRQSAESPQHGPKRSEYIADILSLRSSIPQKSRDWCWKSMKWRWREDAVEVTVKIQVPFPSSFDCTHHLLNCKCNLPQAKNEDNYTKLVPRLL